MAYVSPCMTEWTLEDTEDRGLSFEPLHRPESCRCHSTGIGSSKEDSENMKQRRKEEDAEAQK